MKILYGRVIFQAKIGKHSVEESKAMFKQAQIDLKEAKRVLIVGGGPVAVELAGGKVHVSIEFVLILIEDSWTEIKTTYREKPVTIVGSNKDIVSSTLTEKFRRTVTKKLTEEGHSIFRNVYISCRAIASTITIASTIAITIAITIATITLSRREVGFGSAHQS